MGLSTASMRYLVDRVIIHSFV